MTSFRRLLGSPALAALIFAAALALRLLVPAGYMPVVQGERLVLAICGGAAPSAAPAMPMAHGTATMTHGGHHDDAPAAPESPCAFADLSLPIVGGADPLLLVAAIVFAIAAAVRRAAAAPRQVVRHLRPPSHAPPFPA